MFFLIWATVHSKLHCSFSPRRFSPHLKKLPRYLSLKLSPPTQALCGENAALRSSFERKSLTEAEAEARFVSAVRKHISPFHYKMTIYWWWRIAASVLIVRLQRVIYLMCRCNDCWSITNPFCVLQWLQSFLFLLEKRLLAQEVLFFFSLGTAMTPRGEKKINHEQDQF